MKVTLYPYDSTVLEVCSILYPHICSTLKIWKINTRYYILYDCPACCLHPVAMLKSHPSVFVEISCFIQGFHIFYFCWPLISTTTVGLIEHNYGASMHIYILSLHSPSQLPSLKATNHTHHTVPSWLQKVKILMEDKNTSSFSSR